ncbi:MAG: ribonuclease P protein component [Deltaproteobacteria bacterium]|uniref:Ribonuclease P protein component n=1 Tax=Candidatus Zymogenus saltonus TaxID=2844893 RepID=A0A9D8KGT7_9DELT|nr:ribonuclease P protein component [Candidatus Zymogenus saltonus]
MEKKTFSRSERIRKKTDFERFKLYRGKTTKVFGGPFVIIQLPNNLDITRIGIRVPKKIGKAYVRNRIKRLIREVFRQNKKAFPPSADLLIIVTERPGALSLNFFMEEIIGAVSRLSEKLKTDREKGQTENGF